jgi:CheY-like chemotaxis protein
MIKILHVEDDLDIQEITKMALELVGEFDVLQCASGMEALSVVQAFAPDVLLLDVMMPGMSGETTLSTMRGMDNLANVPAIFMTARAQAQEIERFRDAGALDVIIKPFDPLTLADQIKQILSVRVGLA